jgi:hypothetical protein
MTHDDPDTAAERELRDLEHKGEHVKQDIDEARRDWEAKKHDPKVPGAAGDPDRAAVGGTRPETAYPAKGSAEEAGEKE